jgi:hypothetical protein
MKDQSKTKEVISIRLNQSEQGLLDELRLREGLNRSEYLRFLIKDKERVFTLSLDEKNLLKKEFSHLSLLASNINQIAYQLNLNALQQKPIAKNPDDVLLFKEDLTDQISILQTLISRLIQEKAD